MLMLSMFLMTCVAVAGDGGCHDDVVVGVGDVGDGVMMMTYLRRNGDHGGVFCGHLTLSRGVAAACCCPVFSFFVQHNSRFSFLDFFCFLFDLSFSVMEKRRCMTRRIVLDSQLKLHTTK